MTKSNPMLPQPLTDEETAAARDAITRWHDEQVSRAEEALAEAEQVVSAAHCARAAWFGGDAPSHMDAICISAAAGQRFTDEAMRVVNGRGGDRERAEALRAEQRLVARYLRETYGHDTSGKGAV